MKEIQNNIVRAARAFNGQKEKEGNKGFVNFWFWELMKSVGFYIGAPWCGFFVILVWRIAGAKTNLISASSYTTMIRATKAGNWHTEPIEGAIVVYRLWRNGKPTKKGHLGIVTELKGSAVGLLRIQEIGGNTDSNGDREGDSVTEKEKTINWKSKTGLVPVGFIYPEAT